MGGQSSCMEAQGAGVMHTDISGELERHDPVPEGEMVIDAGIRRYVLVLRAQGVETFESCQGGEGHALPEPTVRFYGNSVEGYRAFTAAMNYGLPVSGLRRAYDVIDGQLVGPHWEMTFASVDPAD